MMKLHSLSKQLRRTELSLKVKQGPGRGPGRKTLPHSHSAAIAVELGSTVDETVYKGTPTQAR